MTGILVIAIVALIVAHVRLRSQVRALAMQLRQTEDRPLRDEAQTVRVVREASIVATPEKIATHADPSVLPTTDPSPAPDPEPIAAPDIPLPDRPNPERAEQPAPRRPARIGFEAIVGGKLPIWTGGAALVLAAFFLVRYSIENGLLGPSARTTIAGLFGLALIGASEGARRLAGTRDDPRIGQALAGAGIAILYGTLYIGAALYHLIGTGAAFALMIAVTAGGLGLALRHGPPTAIMALIGGFSAPLIAGFDHSGIGPLLIYLALFVAALFGLAIRRGWMWLALAACGGGFLWVNILIVVVAGHDLAGIGGFVLLLALGTTLALPSTGPSTGPNTETRTEPNTAVVRPWLRLLPLVAGLLQLLVLAPALDFGPLAWGLYLLLSAAALWLGWRDPALLPGAGAALALILGLLGVALMQGDQRNAPVAAVIVTLLFGIPGHLLARRSWRWATIALGAVAGPVIVGLATAAMLLPPGGWAALLSFAALACAALSWRGRDEARPVPVFAAALTGGAASAALLAGLAIAETVPVPWRWPIWLGIGVALAGWSRRSGDGGVARLAPAPAIVTVVAALIGIEHLRPYGASIVTAAPAPPLADLIALGVLPVAALAATARLLTDARGRQGIGWVALVLALAFVPAVLPTGWHAAGLGVATAIVILLRPLPYGAVAAGVATLIFALAPLFDLLVTAGGSLLGNRLPYRTLPRLGTVLRELTLPAALIAAAWYRRRPSDIRWRAPVIGVLTGIAVASLYVLAKTPLAIATLPRFETLGFAERIVITHLIFAAGWSLRTRQPIVARALTIGALARFVWFDLLILNPVFVTQSTGPLPLLNLATIDTALAAAWLWPYRGDRRGRIALLLLILVSVAATVRQATHGAFLTGPIGRTENWLYSAALLGLAIVWLARGIRGRLDDVRVAGLVLLTAVTLKVFVIDAAALEGVLRILSFLGLGLALIGIGWAYTRFVAQKPMM